MLLLLSLTDAIASNGGNDQIADEVPIDTASTGHGSYV
jgi:hypothetical protein